MKALRARTAKDPRDLKALVKARVKVIEPDVSPLKT